MAKMCPTEARYFDPKSKEKNLFDILKQLPDDYYVFHSFRITRLVPDKGLNENETDFLVFNPKYGCLFIEAKNRYLRKTETGWEYLKKNYDDPTSQGEWKHMHNPFDQAFSAQHNLFEKFVEMLSKKGVTENKNVTSENKKMLEILGKIKCSVAVWLPKYSQSEIDNNALLLGPSISKELILTKDDMYDINKLFKKINTLMERMNKIHLVCKWEEQIDDANGYKNSATKEEAELFRDKLLNPVFKTITSLDQIYNDTYITLLEEQYIVLDFLNFQKTAAIKGGSGTGKTLVAVERAKRICNAKERVLFLCYNKNLRDWLNKSYSEKLKYVDFYTLDAFARKECGTKFNEPTNYIALKKILEEKITNNEFYYNHIIVDEGQDFGRDNVDDSGILDLFNAYGSGDFNEDQTKATSFFIFYDDNQLVNSSKIPNYLNNVDSKLTLYKNCRNTKKIANAAYSLINKTPIFNNNWEGNVPSAYFYSSHEEFIKKINSVIKKSFNDKESKTRVIITCNSSLLFSEINETKNPNYGEYKTDDNIKTKLFTASTYKGLEADDVILIDVDENIFNTENKSFYVAASRAKKNLYVLVNRKKFNSGKILNEKFPNVFKSRDLNKTLLSLMHINLVDNN